MLREKKREQDCKLFNTNTARETLYMYIKSKLPTRIILYQQPTVFVSDEHLGLTLTISDISKSIRTTAQQLSQPALKHSPEV